MTEKPVFKEAQYSYMQDHVEKHGISRLGMMRNQDWHDDPRRFTFTFSRYKFAAKMLAGKSSVVEIGCGDAFASRLVQQTVGSFTAVDFDPIFIDDIKNRMNPEWPLQCFVHDILDGPVPGEFDGALSLDVLEHVDPRLEHKFLENTAASLTKHGVFVVGMPSLESQAYASPQSKEGHVNCKSGDDFLILMQRYFHNVFLFSMNDEALHTGFYPMAHYLIAVCCDKK